MRISQYVPYPISTAYALVAVGLMTVASSRNSVTGAFLVLSGQDTITVEQYRRAAMRLDIELVDRESLLRNSIRAALSPSGDIVRLRLQRHRLGAPNSVPPLGTVSLKVGRDTTITEARMTNGDWAIRKFAGGPDLHPYLDGSLLLMQEALKRARTLGVDTLTFLWFAAENPGGKRSRVEIKDDSVIVKFRDLEIRLATDPGGNILGGSIPSRSLRIEHAFRPFKPRAADPVPNYAAAPDAPYTGTEVTVATADGNTLAGTLTIPKLRSSQVPAVVLISGGGPQDRNGAEPAFPNGYRGFQQIADTLGRRGIAVLRLDDRGTSASTGDPAGFTSELYARDIHEAVGFLRSQPGIDGQRIALLGHSEGGSVAAMVAAKDTSIGGIVLLGAPARTGKLVMIEQSRWLAAHHVSLSLSGRDSALAAAGREYDVDSTVARVRRTVLSDLRATLEHGVSASELDSILAETSAGTDFASLAMPASERFFLAYDPVPTALKVHAPILVLQGENDRQVRAEHAAELVSAFRRGGNADVTVHVFRGLNHLFVSDSIGDPREYRNLPSQNVSPAVLGTIADWLADHLKVHASRGRVEQK